MKKSQITFLEQISQLSFKQYNNIQIGVSFISIIGYDSSINRNKKIQTMQEKTTSRLLGKMCSQKFRNILFDVSIIKAQFNIQKIAFKISVWHCNLMNLHHHHCLQDQQNIIQNLEIGILLWNGYMQKQTAEIALQDKDKQLDRLKKFLNYILNQIKQIGQITNSQDQFTQLTLLIEALTYAILISSKQKNKEPILLDVEEEDFKNILQTIEVTSQSYEICNMIIRLFTTLIKLPQPYVLNMQLQQTEIQDMTQLLLQKSPLYKLRLFSILVWISNDVVNLIKPHIHKFFEQTIESLKKQTIQFCLITFFC
ncbi:unnamed protein product [Paramecium sonneborni]|uniref:Uncharacterized protein n=1 Tax=Paramecium sonneborni TaxID=65129 RepID=A0A8S1RR13_9CILI|nr:unnamed protein product [Paramecium sonneborni]